MSGGKSSKTDGHRDQKAEVLPYYHHRIHRVDVEPMLRQNGDFILRKMRQDGTERYVVSVRWSGKVKHFPIQKLRVRYCFEARGYRHIRDLIEFHIETGTPLTHASGARLERPQDRRAWELLAHQLDLKKQLGKGNFGTVFEAILTRQHSKPEPVAVKTLDKVVRENDDTKLEEARVEMLEEARIMRALSGHQNVVKCEGVTIDKEHPMAVMEIVRGGSLDKLLRDPSRPLLMDEKLKLGAEAADGLQYIHRNGYLHRDLAARNCLVEKLSDGRNGRLKITDFGLTRYVGDGNVYKLTSVAQMPVAWSALESLEQLLWTRESDIWSLGVLIWEILNDGAMPYNDQMEFGKGFAITFLKQGSRLEILPDVPTVVADALKKCWDAVPGNRPDAVHVREALRRGMKKK